MKLYFLLLIVLVTVLSLVDAAPSKGSTKASLKKKQTCAKDCGDNYKPICAGDGSKNLSFGSECVLSNYNCENQKSIVSRLGAAPGGRRPPMNCMFGQMEDCQLDSGPVCGIDDSGILETFENKCMAYVMACQKDTYFVEVKPGEC
ncbi:hypothetical protein HUJ05_002283 [Dendroctonus ponderosae]|nr:hypothetical protein HUJ05_002283 [Dendroctonus ponderosae]